MYFFVRISVVSPYCDFVFRINVVCLDCDFVFRISVVCPDYDFVFRISVVCRDCDFVFRISVVCLDCDFVFRISVVCPEFEFLLRISYFCPIVTLHFFQLLFYIFGLIFLGSLMCFIVNPHSEHLYSCFTVTLVTISTGRKISSRLLMCEILELFRKDRTNIVFNFIMSISRQTFNT